jgi:hypothetical protein
MAEKKSDQAWVGSQVPKVLKDAYLNKCEKVLGQKRKGDVPIRKFITDFTNGRIYIVDGKLHIVEKK